jgi:hypothetical protein
MITIDIVRRNLGDKGEQVALQITANPTFEVWEKLLATQLSANPALWFAPWLAFNPFAHLWLGPGPKLLPEPSPPMTVSGSAGDQSANI